MLLIHKGTEPPSLTAYRKTSFAYYDGCNKDDIRQNLLQEQGFLCAYCMRRIDARHMKIEHWRPEHLLSESEKLDYGNMLGVCMGHMEGQPGKSDTCDAKKGEQVISVNPCVPEHIQSIFYEKGTGIIRSTDSEIASDLDDSLNLNCEQQWLPANRRAALQRVIEELSKRRRSGTWKKTDIQKMLRFYETPDAQGKLREYAGIILWYLRRKGQGNFGGF